VTCSVLPSPPPFELTREVFLPDQSETHTKSAAKYTQVLFHVNIVEICAWLCKKFFQRIVCDIKLWPSSRQQVLNAQLERED
jgi:hypothetical protein